MSAPNQAWSGFGQLSYIDSVFGLDLESRTFLACPARFERATYALEALKNEAEQQHEQWDQGV